ncbi:MAG: glycosyltransferase family 2 protein, partial [Bacteroidales bacterium]|nr:glycosyltransferase family 2 protein [Bacteroidales bacterium]
PEDRLKSVFFKRFWLDMMAAAVFLLKGATGDFKAVFKARRDFRRAKPLHKGKRETIAPKACPLVYGKSIVLEYNLKKHKTFGELNPEKFS